jgi:4-hydroxy-tetrahydrodipicolinate reductase
VSRAPLRLLLLGHGRMGRLVDDLAAEYGCTVVARITRENVDTLARAISGADVVVDFSTADAFVANFPAFADAGVAVVVGTTGWQAHEPDFRRRAADAGIGVVAAANFSPGLNRFAAVVAHAARHFAGSGFGAWIHEAHHAAKRDAPSGTALQLQRTMADAGYAERIDMSSTRAGAIPGTHTVGFDQASETITLTHTVRDRTAFARGALDAARWIPGRRGWFTMQDVLGVG